MLAYLAPRAIPGVESVVGGVYRRTTQSCGYPGVIEVRDHGDGEHLEIVAHLASFTALIDEVVRVRRLFGTDVDPAPALRVLSGDSLLGTLATCAPGIRLPGAWDRFETGVRILLGQQISVQAATTLAGRLVERYGEPIEMSLPPGLTHVFPSPSRLAQADNLADIGIPAARARTVREFAHRFADGNLQLEGTMSLDVLISKLMGIPGVGPWSAHLLAARVFGHPDAFPAGDLGLQRSAARLAGRSGCLGPGELERLSQGWSPFRSAAAAHLWFAAVSDQVQQGRI